MDFVPLRNWPHDSSPFHAASLAVQRRLGVAEKLDAQGRRMITAALTEQHREFFAQLPFVLAGACDASGQPWATMLFGQPGFMEPVEAGSLRIDAKPLAGDPLEQAFEGGAQVGLLGIDPSTRRRNRVNGRIAGAGKRGFELQVEQAFGNCPKYIHHRSFHFVQPGAAQRTQLHELDQHARNVIAQADTLFIASANADGDAGDAVLPGVDVSHRGGKPGFVRVDQDGTLTMPDFVGNLQFRTIGNIASEPRAGLLFPDFAGGDLLYLAVDAEVIWDGEEVKAFAGAQRLLRFRVREMIRLKNAMPLHFDDGEPSPFLDATGSWGKSSESGIAVNIVGASG